MSAPEPLVPFSIVGERLTIRPFERSDIGLIEEVSNDVAITSITTVPSEYSDKEGLGFIERQHSRAATGFGWSMAIVEAGRAVGQIGLWMANAHQGRAEIGYWVVESARGRGIAAEAVVLVGDWAFANLAVHRLGLFVEPWNSASMRTAERAGYEGEALLAQWQVIDGEPKDMWSYVRLKQ